MHILSKTDVIKLRQTGNFSKNQDHLHVITAIVQTNEEAQAYVHDLDPSVTVQILDDLHTVLPLGKLCE